MTKSKTKKATAGTKADRQLAADWELMESKWRAVASFAGKYSVRGKLTADTMLTLATQKREIHNSNVVIRSLKDRGASTAPAKVQRYTGTEMIGVATMHKSNMVPVFRADDAVDIANMRR